VEDWFKRTVDSITQMDRPPTYKIDGVYKVLIMFATVAPVMHLKPAAFQRLTTELKRLERKLYSYNSDFKTDYRYPLLWLREWIPYVESDPDIQAAVRTNEWSAASKQALVRAIRSMQSGEDQNSILQTEVLLFKMSKVFFNNNENQNEPPRE
jgi:hypothetical protein